MTNYDEDILQMDFKQLRAKVEELDIIISKMKREVTSQLENLDESNFASHIVKRQGSLRGEIKITAEKLESLYSDAEKMQSRITQTAERIETEVERLDGSIAAEKSIIEQTSSMISFSVEKDFTPMLSQAVEGSSKPGSSADKTRLYHYNNEYLFYNTLSQKWEKLTDNKIMSSIVLSANGVKVSGDMIVDGTLTGVSLQTTPVGEYGNYLIISNSDGGIRFYQDDKIVGAIRSYPTVYNGKTVACVNIGSLMGEDYESYINAAGRWNFSEADKINMTNTTIDFTGASITGLSLRFA